MRRQLPAVLVLAACVGPRVDVPALDAARCTFDGARTTCAPGGLEGEVDVVHRSGCLECSNHIVEDWLLDFVVVNASGQVLPEREVRCESPGASPFVGQAAAIPPGASPRVGLRREVHSGVDRQPTSSLRCSLGVGEPFTLPVRFGALGPPDR